MPGVGPAEAAGIALEVLEALRFPSNRKTLTRILKESGIDGSSYDAAVDMIRAAYERF